MEIDVLQEDKVSPCEYVPREKLSAIIKDIHGSINGPDDFDDFEKGSYRISEDRIMWHDLRDLLIVGRANMGSLPPHDELNNLAPGLYINADNSWLCVFIGDVPEIYRYIDLCSEKLESLYLYNTSVTQLDLSHLTGLTGLHFENNRVLTKVTGLEYLTNLLVLNFIRNKNLQMISGLGYLSRLTKLDLSQCFALKELPGLEHLTQLTMLRLYRCEHLTALPGLEHLTQLTRLDLGGCGQLTALPGLERLTQLTTMYLSGCDQLTALPSLEHLTQLTTLKLSDCEQLTALPGLEHLTQLTRLDLVGCEQLTTLPGLEHLTQLTELSLWGYSSLRELPDGIRHLKKLRRLNLADCHFRTLPDWLPDIAERFTTDVAVDYGENKAVVGLGGTTVDDIPDMSIFDQPYEMVVKFFEERRLGRTKPLNEIKVVFLGDGEAGKSYTIARLMNDGGDPVDYRDCRTPGIDIKNHPCKFRERSFHVNYWDFGGQEIMHAMHRVFLTERTMYVVLVDASKPDPEKQARNWLDNIQSFAPNAPVLLVLNKIDQNENASVDEPYLRGQYDKLTQVVRLSALKDTQEEFNRKFTNILMEEILKTGYLDARWPESWLNVKNRMENLGENHISVDEYEEICGECQVVELQMELLDWFNDLGVSFCCRTNYQLEEQVVLQPRWITNGLYIILFNKCTGVVNGMVPRRSIHDLLRRARTDPNIQCTDPGARYRLPHDAEYVLNIMRQFGLSYDAGEDREFIPMLCQEEPKLELEPLSRDERVQELHMNFAYLPSNVLYKLMVKRYTELDKDCVWRTGARFVHPGTGLSAVAAIDGNTLRFFIRHTDAMHRPNTYLTALKTETERIVAEMSLKAPEDQLIYKFDGRTGAFDYEELKEAWAYGDTSVFSKVWKRRLNIEDILNQSAPDGLEDERKLLDTICESCRHIQADEIYYLKPGESGWGMEDKRNRRIRDDLETRGYDVKDQTQRGRSGSGRGVGELDLLLYNEKREPWTIIEALRVSTGTKTEWNKHLDKLLQNYNYFGAPCLYLLTYVDSDVTDFGWIWKSYLDHIPGHAPGKFDYCPDSLVELTDGPRYVKRAKCRYSCGGQVTTVYHIFVQIPRKDEV